MPAQPPAGVQLLTDERAREAVRKNLLLEVFGQSKTGKTHLAVRAERPLYVVMLDPNDNLDLHMLNMTKEGFEGEVWDRRYAPMRYSLLTQDEAERRVNAIWAFADWARNKAREEAGNGKPGGTFVLDGGRMFKGYLEKTRLGESTTLGWRAKRGERGGPSKYEYAITNQEMKDFICSFVGTPLDFVITYEGREEWTPKYDPDTGRTADAPSGRWESTSHLGTAFGLKAQVETLKVRERHPTGEPGKFVEVVVPKVKLHWNSYGLYLEERTMPAHTLIELKKLFLGDLAAEDVLDEPGTVEVRANMEPLDGEDKNVAE